MANLSLAVNRNDIIICDVKLNPTVKCLNNCINNLEQSLVQFEEKVKTIYFTKFEIKYINTLKFQISKVKKKNKFKNKIVFPTVIVTAAVLFCIHRFCARP